MWVYNTEKEKLQSTDYDLETHYILQRQAIFLGKIGLGGLISHRKFWSRGLNFQDGNSGDSSLFSMSSHEPAVKNDISMPYLL